MFGQGMVMKDDFLVYSIYPVFLIKRLVPGNVVMVATDMCGKNPTRRRGHIELCEHVCFNISIHFT